MTIGFNHLGRHGRLGNQMFQYAGLRGIAAHRGFDFMIPQSDFKDEWNDHQLFEAFKLKNLTNIGVCPGTYVQEAHFHFDENLFNNMPDGHNIYAYLQSTKYFDHIEEEPVTDLHRMVISEVEIPLFEAVMKYTGNNQSKASVMLGLNRGTLRTKLKGYGLL